MRDQHGRNFDFFGSLYNFDPESLIILTVDFLLVLCYNTSTIKKGELKMKRIIIIITVTVLFIAAGMCAWFADMHREARLNTKPATCEYYALTTCVVEIDRDSDIVTCEDSNGNLWEFYGCEDWEIGDCASLLMDNQGTESIYDDSIEAARYNAWTLNQEG